METNIYLSKYYDFFLSVLKKGRANFIVYPTLYQGKNIMVLGLRDPSPLSVQRELQNSPFELNL